MLRTISAVTLALLALLLIGCSVDEPTSPPAVPAPADGQFDLDKACGNAPGAKVLPPNARPHGRSYAEWTTAWWKWLISIPYYENPGLDTDGSFVALNQTGKVWFLAPNYGGGQVDVRHATIPTGTMLFIDVAGFVGSPPIGDPSDPDALRAVLKDAVDGISDIVFEVDGRPLRNIGDYRIRTPLFTLTFPPDNVFGVEPGSYYPSAAEGYFVMLAPLSRGEHTIHIFADLGSGFGTSEVTFHLTVE